MRFTESQTIFLDVCRGVAAQLVLIGHVVGVAGFANEPKLLFQNFGVMTFFILSGLLITSSVLSKSQSYSFSDYLIDRGSRIFVPYIPAVVFVVLAGLAFSLPGDVSLGTILANVFMLEDFPLWRVLPWFPEIDRVGTARPLWSVAMEWWIYMGMAVVYFSDRLPRWAYFLVIPGLFVLAFNLAIGMLAIVWLTGAVIAYFLPKLTRTTGWWLIGAVALAAISTRRLITVGGDFYDLQFCLLLAMTMLLTLKAIQNWCWISYVTAPAAVLSSSSYSLYLTHYTVMEIGRLYLTGWPLVVTVFVTANIFGYAMWYAFERHYGAVGRWIRARASVVLARPHPQT